MRTFSAVRMGARLCSICHVQRHAHLLSRQLHSARSAAASTVPDISASNIPLASMASSPASLLAAHLTPAVLRHVAEFGFAVVDHALSHAPGTASAARALPSAADMLRSSILDIHRAGAMTLNHTHLVHAATKSSPQRRAFVPKHSIYEADFTTQADTLLADPLWKDFVGSRETIDALNRHFASTSGLSFDRQTVKAQVCTGNGGCFPSQF